MTDGAGVICRRCGFANVAGDQFCGSCGAFLEWEGEVADGVAPVAAPDADVVGDEGISGLVHPTVTAAASPEPTPPPVIATPIAPPPVGALLRCPACGIANAGTRTFCQSCGTRLAETARVTEATREQIAAAVTATPGPRTVPVTGVTSGRTGPSSGGSRGIAGWLIVMAVLGIVVGVGFVAASVLLKSPGPATGATASPSVMASNEPDNSPGASAGPEGTAGATGAPTAAPTAKVEDAKLELTAAAASSVVGGLAKFAADRAIDGNNKTCWQEGAKAEKGQWIEVAFASSRVVAVDIVNGYAASTAQYKGNHRPRVVRISVDGGEPVEVTLKDTAKVQRIKLGEIAGATRLRITIVSVYPAVKTAVSGTPFDDAAISEISVIGTAGG
ncbi:MAG: zinc ribbon domain-containing protein [Chloroflexota bacterium]|nr:zinc ribbon domain-containing protein [Chloroflexota bacterium]